MTVKDYFDGAAMPGLTRAGGGYMAGDLVASLALPASGGDLAQPVRPAPSAVVGRIASLSGDASVIHGNGLVDSLEVADPVHQGDYLFPRDGSLTIVFADGTRLTVEDGGQVMVRHVAYEPASISGAIVLEAAGGRFLLATGSLSEHPGRPIVVQTPLARIEIGAASVQFRHDAARGLDVTLLDDLNLREDALVVDNAAGRASAMQAGAHITVADDQQAPLLAEAPARAEPEDFAPAAGLESSAEAPAAESADGVEVSPGGDENALSGDPIVVSGTVGFFDLRPQPAPLASPTLLEPSLGTAPSPLVRHDSVATPSLGTLAISAPEEPEPPEQLRDWEPLGLVWDVSGSAMVTGNAPALPYETDGRQIITTEKLTMAGLALSPDQRPTGELEGFLGLAGGSIAAAGAQGTVPVDGSAIRAKLSLAAGSTPCGHPFAWAQAGQRKPAGQRAVNSQAAQAASSG